MWCERETPLSLSLCVCVPSVPRHFHPLWKTYLQRSLFCSFASGASQATDFKKHGISMSCHSREDFCEIFTNPIFVRQENLDYYPNRQWDSERSRYGMQWHGVRYGMAWQWRWFFLYVCLKRVQVSKLVCLKTWNLIRNPHIRSHGLQLPTSNTQIEMKTGRLIWFQ